MTLHVIQTSDDRRYLPMLQASERLTRAFCAQRGYRYTAFTGMKRGRAPVHAAYNRIFMLHELMAQGHRDWVLYMDADAYIQDMDFDVDAYLAENAAAGYDFIAAEASVHLPQIWCINNGVYFINLGSEAGQRIVLLMRHLVDTLVPAEYWDDPDATWAPEDYDDQNMLYGVLARDDGVQGRIKKESGEVFNYRGRFIAQCLRTDYPTLDSRIGFVRDRCDELWQAHARRLGEANPPLPSQPAPPLSLLMPAAEPAVVLRQCAALLGLDRRVRDHLELLLVGPGPDVPPLALEAGLQVRRLQPTTAVDSGEPAAAAAAAAAGLGLGGWLAVAAPGRWLDSDGLAHLLGGLSALDAAPVYRFRAEGAAADDAVLLAARHLAGLGGLSPLPGHAPQWQLLLAHLAMRAQADTVAITNIGWQTSTALAAVASGGAGPSRGSGWPHAVAA
jgi:hypothetical protein